MGVQQVSNVLTLAAALSMAGYISRSPETAPQNYINNFNDQNNVYNNRFHPYQQSINQFGYQQQQAPNQHGPLVEQAVASHFASNNQNNLYQSKDAEETFQAYLELQELIGWQESYRRGDLQIHPQNNNQQYVMPVTSYNLENVFTNGNDDGYGSGSSVGSPGSSIDQIANDIDSFSEHSSNSGSPSPSNVNGFDHFDNSFPAAQPFQQINNPAEGSFDIDELLNGDGALSPEMPYNVENQKVPFSNLLNTLDQELDYKSNSPSALKNPSVDSFLVGKPSPEYKPSHTVLKNDDPFNVKFTNGSLPDDFNSNTLVDIGSFDPSIFEDENEDDMLDNALVQSLMFKGNPAAVAIKEEEDDDYWLNPGSPMVEHDYFNRDESRMATNPINKHQPQLNYNRPPNPLTRQVAPRSTASPVSRFRERTFAPSHTTGATSTRAPMPTTKPSSVKPKIKKQKQKSNVLWSDFPYTAIDLVEMPVEKFNEIIKQLDEIRQHVAKDERRKGKNKLAARNCRKRKMDVIDSLDTGVSVLEQQRLDLLKEREQVLEETRQIKVKTEWLNNYIFEHLRDSNGVPYDTRDFSLKYTSDGNVYVVPSVGGGDSKTN